jgi:hypothetical protein
MAPMCIKDYTLSSSLFEKLIRESLVISVRSQSETFSSLISEPESQTSTSALSGKLCQTKQAQDDKVSVDHFQKRFPCKVSLGAQESWKQQCFMRKRWAVPAIFKDNDCGIPWDSLSNVCALSD